MLQWLRHGQKYSEYALATDGLGIGILTGTISPHLSYVHAGWPYGYDF
jgi:hypothetical protein